METGGFAGLSTVYAPLTATGMGGSLWSMYGLADAGVRALSDASPREGLMWWTMWGGGDGQPGIGLAAERGYGDEFSDSGLGGSTPCACGLGGTGGLGLLGTNWPASNDGALAGLVGSS